MARGWETKKEIEEVSVEIL